MSVNTFLRRRVLINQGVLYNTVIGGQGAITTTAGELETLLGLSGGDVSYFNLDGNDIQAMIDIDYTLLYRAFKNNTNITSYIDTDEHIVGIENEVFQNDTNLVDVLFLGALVVGNNVFRSSGLTSIVLNSTEIGSNCFRDNSDLVTFSANYLTSKIGLTDGDNNVFLNDTSLTSVSVARVCETNNAGGRDGDIAYAEDILGATITYF